MQRVYAPLHSSTQVRVSKRGGGHSRAEQGHEGGITPPGRLGNPVVFPHRCWWKLLHDDLPHPGLKKMRVLVKHAPERVT